jgi:hypothetical protein
MKIALCSGSKDLPFGYFPTNPIGLYDPSILEDWIYRIKREQKKDGKEYEEIPALEHWIMPVLNGLSSIDLPGIMASVSAVFNYKNKLISIPDIVWVQITTKPKEWDEGLPIIVDTKKEIQVEYLWGYSQDNPESREWYITKESASKARDRNIPEYWKTFFIFKLLKAKESAFQKQKEAKKILEDTKRTYKMYDSLPLL